MQCTNHASRIAQSRKAAIQRGDLPPTGRPIPQHTQATACAAMQRVDGVLQQVRAAGQGFVAPPQHTHPPARHTRPQDTLTDGPCGRRSHSMCHHRVRLCADTGCLVCLGSRNRSSASRCLHTRAQARGDPPCCLARAGERKQRDGHKIKGKERNGSCHKNKNGCIFLSVLLSGWGGDGAVMGGGRISAGRGPLRVADVV